MDSPQTENRAARPGSNNVGLIANGSAGSWDVALDESLSGVQKWFLQIEGPAAYLYFQISGPKVIDRVLSFLGADSKLASGAANDLDVGRFGTARVSLIWDSEIDRRCCILIDDEASRVRVTANSQDITDLIAALGQVRSDLHESGLLIDSVKS